MRDKHICPKCQHNEVLHIEQVADVLGDWADRETTDRARERPRQEAQSRAFRIARVPSTSPAETATAGLVQAYVCRACGYSELYTTDPAKIPVDGTLVTLLKGRHADPYR